MKPPPHPIRTSSPGLGLAVLLLVAMLLRAAIPTGWMPDTARGPAALVICTASGAQHLPNDGGLPGSAHTHHEVCAFAGLAAAPPPPPAALPAPMAWADAPLTDARQRHRAVLRRRHREQAARAPPLLA
ncbi:DUF2946 family protein [Phenylobacterium sp.]|uniref:DUF2946 family protein n=1 Tax=Phenylobacterium sp. TaxID=1871053 RepID=UPI002DEEA4A2|nr:DUF2946 family protein [Phenylobacterium sp.]